jgi:hypothetical protein
LSTALIALSIFASVLLDGRLDVGEERRALSGFLCDLQSLERLTVLVLEVEGLLHEGLRLLEFRGLGVDHRRLDRLDLLDGVGRLVLHFGLLEHHQDAQDGDDEEEAAADAADEKKLLLLLVHRGLFAVALRALLRRPPPKEAGPSGSWRSPACGRRCSRRRRRPSERGPWCPCGPW